MELFNRKIKKISLNFFIILSSIYIPLFLLSFYNFYRIKKINGITYKRQIDEDLPQKINAIKSGYTPKIFPDLFFRFKNSPESYPIGSLPFQKVIGCNEGYGLINTTHDRFGLRNLDEKWENVIEKSNIFVVGDAYTYGACVEDNLTIPSNIEKSTKINTINLGSGANSSYEYAAILKSLVEPIIKKSNQKNTVVLIFDSNDGKGLSIFRNNNKKRDLLSKSSSIVSTSSQNQIYPSSEYLVNIKKFLKKNIKQTNKEIEMSLIKDSKYPYKSFKKTFKHSSLYYTSTLVPIRSGIKSLLTKSFHKESIKILADICKNKCTPIIAYIPNSNYWDKEINFNRNFNPYKMDIEKISRELGIMFIDGGKVIDKNNVSDYSPKGYHLSIEGYKKLSNEIVKTMNKN